MLKYLLFIFLIFYNISIIKICEGNDLAYSKCTCDFKYFIDFHKIFDRYDAWLDKRLEITTDYKVKNKASCIITIPIYHALGDAIDGINKDEYSFDSLIMGRPWPPPPLYSKLRKYDYILANSLSSEHDLLTREYELQITKNCIHHDFGSHYNDLIDNNKLEEAISLLEDIKSKQEIQDSNDKIRYKIKNYPILYNTLANLYLKNREYRKAIQLCNININRLKRNKIIGHNPHLKESYRIIILSHYLNNNISSAISFSQKLIDMSNAEIEGALLLDERSRILWKRNIFQPINWVASIIPPNIASEYITNNKGVFLDSLIEDRINLPVEAWKYKKIIDNLQSSISDQKNIKKQGKIINEWDKKINSEAERNASIDNNNQNRTEFLKHESDSVRFGFLVDKIESNLLIRYFQRKIIKANYKNIRATPKIKMTDIVPALSGGGLLIDFFLFNDPNNIEDYSTRLGVLLTTEKNNSFFIEIKNWDQISEMINSLNLSLKNGDISNVEKLTYEISEKLWAPISAYIPDNTSHLFISPESNVNFLSFASLLDVGGQFVCEKYKISYIGSGRDLAFQPKKNYANIIKIFANPEYSDLKVKKTRTPSQISLNEQNPFLSVELPSLPGTEAESAGIKNLAVKNGWQVLTNTKKGSSEDKVYAKLQPKILHFATHGFFLNLSNSFEGVGFRGMSIKEKQSADIPDIDPMLASGIALSGASKTFEMWNQKIFPESSSDGVLTAAEVAQLNLSDTWLVTLSACDTGVGDAQSGEGVFGLRRAFKMAGAQNLLMTLWPVHDDITSRFMVDFYKEVFATGDAAGSLSKVQRDWLVKMRNEKGLYAAISTAGPFAMATMTAPSNLHVQKN